MPRNWSYSLSTCTKPVIFYNEEVLEFATISFLGIDIYLKDFPPSENLIRVVRVKLQPSTIIKMFLGLFLIVSLPLQAKAANEAQNKHIIGWIEKVKILPEDISVSAKIDTGADHSSLNVINPTEFMKGEEKWIRFSIPVKKDKTVTVERPIVRIARIKRKKAPGLKRPVILFNLCIGTLYKKNVPVNLADRTGFKYHMLIGRSFLKGAAIVDSSLTLTQSPSCTVQ